MSLTILLLLRLSKRNVTMVANGIDQKGLKNKNANVK